MTSITGPNCAVMFNLINTHTHDLEPILQMPLTLFSPLPGASPPSSFLHDKYNTTTVIIPSTRLSVCPRSGLHPPLSLVPRGFHTIHRRDNSALLIGTQVQRPITKLCTTFCPRIDIRPSVLASKDFITIVLVWCGVVPTKRRDTVRIAMPCTRYHLEPETVQI